MLFIRTKKQRRESKLEKTDKQLKIAMLGHKRLPSREARIEIFVEELATRMVALGNDVTCYNRKEPYVSGQEFDSNLNKGICKGNGVEII